MRHAVRTALNLPCRCVIRVTGFVLQVFCCEVDGIFSTLLNDNELQAQLFGLLDHVRLTDGFSLMMQTSSVLVTL